MANLKDLIVNGAARVIGKVYASGGFVGDLDGNAKSATKATQDGGGNPITSTYVTNTTFNTTVNNINTVLDKINGEVV